MRYNWSNASQKPEPSQVLHAGSRSRTWQRFSETLFAKSISVPLLEPGQVFLQGTNHLKNIGELLPERQVKFKRLNKLFNGPWILVTYCQKKKWEIPVFKMKCWGWIIFQWPGSSSGTVNLRLGFWLATYLDEHLLGLLNLGCCFGLKGFFTLGSVVLYQERIQLYPFLVIN